MSRLEERYRFVLRALPGSYRGVWEEDMVAAFLESMQTDDPDEADYLADFGRPGVAEVASVIALATRLRLGIGGTRPWSSLWGSAVQLVVLGWLLTNAALGGTHLAIRWWLSGRISWLPAPPSGWLAAVALSVGATAMLAASLGWLAAYLALVFERRRIARSLALAAAIMTAVVGLTTGGPISVTRWFDVALDLLAVLGLAAFHQDAPPVWRLPWLAALPVGTALMLGVAIIPPRPGGFLPLLDWPGVCCAAVVVAAVVHLARPAGRARRGAPTSLALAILTLVALGWRTATLLDYVRFAPFEQVAVVVAVGVAEAVAVVAVGIPLAVLAVRALRRIPKLTSRVTA